MEKEGSIVSLNEKGFGFLQVEGREKNVFFHAKDLIDVKFDDLRTGDRLSFASIDMTEKGAAAKELELIEA